MNFGEIVKAEIIKKTVRDAHCKKAFLAGCLRGSGTLYEKEGSLGLDFKTGDEETLILLSSYLKTLFNYDLREVSVSEDRLNKKDKFVASIYGAEAKDILLSLGILALEGNGLSVNFGFGAVAEKECCFKAFVRGLFVASGGCTVPDIGEENGTGYHLELVFYHPRSAALVSEKLAEYGIKTKITRRKESYLVYIKSAEEIKDFLAFLPAPVSVLKLTDVMINKELANNSNRQKNCDLGNVTRQVEAAAKYAAAIEKIERIKGLSSLGGELARTAEARKEFPEDTLSELAERLNVTKSCLNHRLRKIVSIAEKT